MSNMKTIILALAILCLVLFLDQVQSKKSRGCKFWYQASKCEEGCPNATIACLASKLRKPLDLAKMIAMYHGKDEKKFLRKLEEALEDKRSKIHRSHHIIADVYDQDDPCTDRMCCEIARAFKNHEWPSASERDDLKEFPPYKNCFDKYHCEDEERPRLNRDFTRIPNARSEEESDEEEEEEDTPKETDKE